MGSDTRMPIITLKLKKFTYISLNNQKIRRKKNEEEKNPFGMVKVYSFTISFTLVKFCIFID